MRQSCVLHWKEIIPQLWVHCVYYSSSQKLLYRFSVHNLDVVPMFVDSLFLSIRREYIAALYQGLGLFWQVYLIGKFSEQFSYQSGLFLYKFWYKTFPLYTNDIYIYIRTPQSAQRSRSLLETSIGNMGSTWRTNICLLKNIAIALYRARVE